MIINLLLVGAMVAAPQPRIGVDVTIDAPTRGPVIAALASVQVNADVEGDIVALGGDVVIAQGVRVSGDVVAVGGHISSPGLIGGRVVSLETVAGFASTARSGPAGFRWGLRCLRVGGWIVLTTLLFLLWPRSVRRAGNHLRAQPGRSLLVAVLSLGAWFATIMVALPLLGSGLGIALLLISVAVFLAVKIAGVVTVAWVLGGALRPALPIAMRGEVTRTGVAMLVLATASVLPLAGGLLWLLVNLVGFGAAVGALVKPRVVLLRVPLLAR